jgi:hypothetical protein
VIGRRFPSAIAYLSEGRGDRLSSHFVTHHTQKKAARFAPGGFLHLYSKLALSTDEVGRFTLLHRLNRQAAFGVFGLPIIRVM